jgi:diadenosine tetraphosphatase ApaH/serine/threonine PP2A family protein phosphatase
MVFLIRSLGSKVTYIIFSDIHSNLEALEAVRKVIGEIAPDKVLCLGDVVGYGASPRECIDLNREMCSVTVAGNHDCGVTGQTDITYFNRYAREAIIWTAKALDEAGMRFLRDLPLTHTEADRFRLVHSTPQDPARWNYIFTHQQAMEEFKAFTEAICFIGHSHQPCIFEMMDEETIIMNTDHVDVRSDRRYIVNVGSVGQPRDGDPRACLCLYDDERSDVTIIRVPYDIEGDQNRIRTTGLPPVLANRLSWGE